MTVSIVIPALNEAASIRETLTPLQAFRRQGHEIIVVDGGSRDGTIAVATPLCDRLLESTPGRARQMNAGAAVAGGDSLWFLHADTLVPENAIGQIRQAVQRSGWGRFDVRLSGGYPLLRLVEGLMNRRSRLTGIATGDQGIFIRRDLFQHVGGYPDLPLMEDIALCKTLRKLARPACLTSRLITSSRRWESRGVLRTIVLMWLLRAGYWLGVSPARLAAAYHS